MSRYIELTRGQRVLVDDEDYEWLSQWRWAAHRKPGRCFYAQRGNPDKKPSSLMMHRVIMNAPKELQVDHINMNTLDNRRANLRLCTHTENVRNRTKYRNNTSGYKGAYWHKQEKKWYARISVDYRDMHLGYTDSAHAAHLLYKAAAEMYHGEFARL